jgi:hypothetical protein
VVYYEQKIGPLATNGKKALGHHEGKDDKGNDIIIVPDAPITRVKYQEKSSVERSGVVGSTKDNRRRRKVC